MSVKLQSRRDARGAKVLHKAAMVVGPRPRGWWITRDPGARDGDGGVGVDPEVAKSVWW